MSAVATGSPGTPGTPGRQATPGGGQDRIGELIAALEALADPAARDCARQLVHEILDLHAAGLSRMLDIFVAGGPASLDVLACDDSVSALLLLHGLHPHDLATRVRHAVDGMRGTLGVQGISIELSGISEDAVQLRLRGNWIGKKLSAAQIRNDIEEAIFAMAPEVAAIEIDNLPDADVHEMKFMPASALYGSHAGDGH